MRLLRLSNCLRADRPKQSKYRTLQAPSNRSFFSLSIRIQSRLKPTPYFAASVRSRGIVRPPKVVASDARDGTASRYVSAMLTIGRGLPIGGLGDSFASIMSVRPTRSYSAEIVSSQ